MTTTNPFLQDKDIHTFELFGTFKYVRENLDKILSIDKDLYIIDGVFDETNYNLAKISSGLIEVPWLQEHIKEAIGVDKEWSALDMKDKIKLLRMLPGSDIDVIVNETSKIDNPSADLKKK